MWKKTYVLVFSNIEVDIKKSNFAFPQECHGDWLAVQHGTVLAQDLQKKFEV